MTNLLKKKSKALNEFDFEINPQTEQVVRRLAVKSGLKIKHIAYTNSCDPDFCGNLIFKTLEEAKKTSIYLSPMYFMQKQ